jgi:hypothetical protein
MSERYSYNAATSRGWQSKMRNWMLGLSVLMVICSAASANADLIMTPRPVMDTSVPESVDQPNAQATEIPLSLTAPKWRVVQRKLTKLGFRAKSSGRLDEQTRDAISRWQEARNAPTTGSLDADQYRSLVGQRVATTDANADRSHRGRGGHSARQSRGIGGPIGAIGGAIGGLFHRL